MNIPSLMLSALLPRLAARMNVLLWIPEPSSFNVKLPRLLFDSSVNVKITLEWLAILNTPVRKDTFITTDRDSGVFIRERGRQISNNEFQPNRQIVLRIQRDNLATRFYEHKPT